VSLFIVCHTEHEILEAIRLRLEKEKTEFEYEPFLTEPVYSQEYLDRLGAPNYALLLEQGKISLSEYMDLINPERMREKPVKLTWYEKLFSGLKSIGL
jgi:hypothetical protein